MSRIVYVNGEFVPEADAKISIFDRGFLFADAVYEVSAVVEGRLIDNLAHVARLDRSLRELDMAAPVSMVDLTALQKDLIQRNSLNEGLVYLQVSRGSAGDRDFAYPAAGTPTSLVMFTQARSVVDNPAADTGIAVITLPDIRWHRRDIKTVGLLAACMAKEAAKAAGAGDAWFVEDGYVTEGSSNNTFIVTTDGTLVTRPLSNDILHGITRKAVLALCARENLVLEERAFTPDEAYQAAEAFSTSASAFVMPVIKIDDRILSNGAPGPVSTKMRQLYIEMARESAE